MEGGDRCLSVCCGGHQVKLGEATQCVQAKDRQLMMKEFPTSYGLPLVKLEPKGAPVSNTANTTTSGRQAGRQVLVADPAPLCCCLSVWVCRRWCA